MSLLTQGISQVTAAAKAGMSERTARKYAHSGRTPSGTKVPHTWRTRPDPFAEVWPEVEALLKQDGGLQAKTIWTELNERHAGRFSAGQLRTLQRRLLTWRVTSGPDREVFFPQTHIPGEQGQSDFTDMRQMQVMIAGELFSHLLYHFVLTYSNWESVSICPSESFESLSAGMQSALWRLGGVPLEHRTDNLSAATHELSESRGRDFTERYRELTDHYGLRASRNFPGNAHENGDVESANGHLKNAIDQRLRLRGSRAFASREAYELKAHDRVLPPEPAFVIPAEGTVLTALWMLRLVLLPQQLARHALVGQLALDLRKVGRWVRRRCGRRRIQPRPQRLIIQICRQRPGQPGRSRPAQTLLHRRARRSQHRCDLSIAQVRLGLQAQHIADLAHGQPRLRHLLPSRGLPERAR